MKILLVNTYYFPNMVGGTENSVKLLAEGLKCTGNEVAVFTIDNLENKSIFHEKVNDIDIFRCYGGLFDVRSRLDKKCSIYKTICNKIIELNNNFIYKKFSKFVDEFNPDVIHTNNLYGLSPVIWKVAKQKNIKVIHTIRDYWILNAGRENVSGINPFIKLYQLYFKRYSKYVDYVTAPSKFTLETLLNNNYFSKANFKTVPNSIDINVDTLNQILKLKTVLDDKNIRFIYVGMLEEKKGIMNLLKAFSNIDNNNISLYICGKGNLEEKVKNFCDKDKRINYCGQLSKDDLEIEWRKSDVCIVPSVWNEPFGRVVIEANQYGLPVIGSNRGGILEILTNIHTGEIFQYDDINDLKDKIIYFSDRSNIKKYYKEIVNNIEFYSLKRQIDNFINIYKEILGDNYESD